MEKKMKRKIAVSMAAVLGGALTAGGALLSTPEKVTPASVQTLYEASRSDFNNLYDFVKAVAEATDRRFFSKTSGLRPTKSGRRWMRALRRRGFD